MEVVSIHGFGSFFNNQIGFRDIDLLILHESTSYESCQFSIWCKKHILSIVMDGDVTILSKSEEQQISFIEKSKATHLGNVYKKSAQKDLDIIIAKVIRYNSTKIVS